MKLFVPEIQSKLRKRMIRVPEIINTVGGINIFGRLIKSLLFSTDVALIKNCNADAVIAVYPFTPQPVITQAIINVSSVPVFCGVGGGTTTGHRVVDIAIHAEHQGAMGVVVNAPTKNELIKELAQKIDIPIIVTIVSESDDITARLQAGAAILNVSGASKTPLIVKQIRQAYPEIPIIATGGPCEESIARTIAAGANAITYTPPTSAEIFKGVMQNYRNQID